MPMCVSLVRQIHQLTELECAELSSATCPLLSLIATHASNGKVEGGSNKGLFVVSSKRTVASRVYFRVADAARSAALLFPHGE